MASSLPALLLLLCSLGVAQATLSLYGLRAVDLNGDTFTETDCYVQLFYDSGSARMTSVKDDDNNPSWNEGFVYPEAEQGRTLRVEVFDKDPIYDDKLGSCQYFLKRGTHDINCYLAEGGTLYFSYTLS
ncbi:Perforin-1 [Nibea albiflora]|uniref:Perforin-1 n=1 Tax=Nibea albiflora TaxID=240163 RepID=A0ACB7F2F8_NIBAL|nr:Perforin-1 [Nibea albiflora]